MKHILIFKTGGTGDMILSEIAINTIKENDAASNIVWAGREPVSDLFRAFHPEIRIFELNRQKSNFKLFRELKSELKSLDLIIDLQKSPRTILLSFLILITHHKAKYVSWNKYGLQRSIMVLKARFRGRSKPTQIKRKPLPRRRDAMKECSIRGLNKIGITTNVRPVMPEPELLNKREKSMAVCLGSFYPAKEISYEKLCELLDFCFYEMNNTDTVYLLGDLDKHNEAEQLKTQYQDKDTRNMCGKTSLSEASAILEKCKFAIANDSALAHLSESVNTPVMMFFGPTHEDFGYRPFLDKSMSFSADLACRPCHKSGASVCRYGDSLCKYALPLELVKKHLKSQFDDV